MTVKFPVQTTQLKRYYNEDIINEDNYLRYLYVTSLDFFGMASSIFFCSQKGEEIVSRHYRSDISKAAFDAFRNKVIYLFISI